MQSELTPALVERAVWIATAIAVGTAAVLTVFVYRVQRLTAAKTGMRVLGGVVGVLLAFGVYVVAVMVFTVVTNAQLRQPASSETGFSMGWPTVFVHPGPLHKLAPLLAIAITWIILAVAAARDHVRETAG